MNAQLRIVEGLPMRAEKMASGLRWNLPALAFTTKWALQAGTALCVIFTAACIGIIGFGRLSGSRFASGFELSVCDGAPCFRGITPDTTGWDSALSVFNGQSMVKDDPSYIQIGMFPSQDNQTVEAVVLRQPLVGDVNVGAVINLYGVPDCVEINPTASTMILHYPQLHVLMRFFENRFQPETPIMLAVLGHISGLNNDPVLPCSRLNQAQNGAQTSVRVWQGFASMQHYLSGV